MKTTIKARLKSFPILFAILKTAYHACTAIRSYAMLLIETLRIMESRKYLRQLLHSDVSYTLYIMHSLGGGTETYLKNILRQQRNYLILRSTAITTRQESFTLESDTFPQKLHITKKDIKTLRKIVSAISIENVYCYKALPYVLETLRDFSVPLSFKLHDYYSLCPSVNLMKENAPCTLSECGRCSFTVGKRQYTGTQWQEMWRHFFDAVSYVYVFSQSSKRIFTATYSVPEEKIILRPHSMAYFKTKKITAVPDKMNIGIFGDIMGEAKGRTVVRDFINFSKEKDYTVYINGRMQDSDRTRLPANCIYAGKYTPEEIYDRIVQQQLDAVFFPSVCAETFSYTVSELMMTGILVACFDIGAQAEKVHEYHLGRIIPDTSPENILKTLSDCYKSGRQFYLNYNGGGVRPYRFHRFSASKVRCA